jgi:hypothetical protein
MIYFYMVTAFPRERFVLQVYEGKEALFQLCLPALASETWNGHQVRSDRACARKRESKREFKTTYGHAALVAFLL